MDFWQDNSAIGWAEIAFTAVVCVCGLIWISFM